MLPRPTMVSGAAGNPLALYDWGGSGPGLLLLHGLGAHSWWWDEVVARLPRGYRVVAADLRGHGESAWTDPPAYAVDDYAADVDAVRAALGWDSFHLAAHSLGARVALRFAGAHPARLESLALFDFYAADWNGRGVDAPERPQPTYSDEDAILARFRLQPPGTTLDDARLRQLGRRGVRRGEDGRWSWKFDWRALYPRMPWDPAEPRRAAVPALLVRGEHSGTMPPGSFKSVLAALPDARGVQLPRAHHHVTLDEPDASADVLAGFLASL